MIELFYEMCFNGPNQRMKNFVKELSARLEGGRMKRKVMRQLKEPPKYELPKFLTPIKQ